MEEPSNGKVEEVTAGTEEAVPETGDEKTKQEASEKDGEYEVEVESSREVVLLDGDEGEKETKDDSKSSSSSSEDEEDEEAKVKKEEKVVPLVDKDDVPPNDDVVPIEPVAVEVATATEDLEDTCVDGVKGLTAPDEDLANGVAATSTELSGETPSSPAVNESGGAVAAVEETAAAKTEELPSKRGTEADSLSAAAAAAANVVSEKREDSAVPQPRADVPVAAEHDDQQELPESTGNPPIISVSRRTLQPTSWKSCCGLFEVFRRSSDS